MAGSRSAVVLASLTLGVLAISAAAVSSGAAEGAAPSCAARPFVDDFVAALNAGDLARLDELFADESAGWVWYFVNDRAGQRLGDAAGRRDTLRIYFAARIRQREALRLVDFRDGGNGNFTFVLIRRANDLRGGSPVTRAGKGWVSCETGKLGVWGLGGAPPPATFGPCPRGAQLLTRGALPAAAAAALRFVREVFVEMSPSLDLRGARVIRATLAPGNVKGYAARVRCGRDVQRRTAVVEVRFPRIAAGERTGAAAFYVSRTRGTWTVWRVIR
jgi:hypothetical protein